MLSHAIASRTALVSRRCGLKAVSGQFRRTAYDADDELAANRASPPTCVVSAALAFLDSKRRVLECLSPADYARLDEAVGGSVGGHMRHTLDHFSKCLATVERSDDATHDRQQGRTSIFYDRRTRGGSVETDPNEAARVIAGLEAILKGLGNGLGASQFLRRSVVRPAFVLAEGGAQGEHIFESNLERELFFCCHHGFHHDAMMRLILQNMGKGDGRKTLGVAPSTAAFRHGRDAATK